MSDSLNSDDLMMDFDHPTTTTTITDDRKVGGEDHHRNDVDDDDDYFTGQDPLEKEKQSAATFGEWTNHIAKR